MSNNEENHTALTAEIVSAYVANNSVQAGNLPALIESMYAAIALLGAPPGTRGTPASSQSEKVGS